MMHQKRLRGLGLPSLVRVGCQGSYNYLVGGNREDGARLFLVVHSKRQ